MISFVNPSWLLGLVGLLIPIGIHLLSRKEGKTIHVGSIRHLYDSDTAQFSSIRLNEILLLLLRLLLITLLVFILAGLKFAQDDYVGKKWLLIEMGVQRDERYKPTLDTLSAQNYEVRWLTEGFPQLADSAGIHGVENYAPLVQKIPRNLDSVVVMSYAFAARVKGERISIPKHVLWFPVEPPGSTIVVDAVRLPQDSVVIRLMASKPTGTTLEYSKLSTHLFDRITKADSLSLRNPDTVTISVYWTQDFSYDRKIIQAAIQTISRRTPHLLKINYTSTVSAISPNTNFLFWLSHEPMPTTKFITFGYSNCKAQHLPLLSSRQSLVNFCESSGFDWVFSKRLSEENVLQESFMYSLGDILLPKNSLKDASLLDRRVLAVHSNFTNSEGETPASLQDEKAASSEPVLAILLFITLVVERLVAYRRNQ